MYVPEEKEEDPCSAVTRSSTVTGRQKELLQEANLAPDNGDTVELFSDNDGSSHCPYYPTKGSNSFKEEFQH